MATKFVSIDVEIACAEADAQKVIKLCDELIAATGSSCIGWKIRPISAEVVRVGKNGVNYDC